MKNKIIFKTLMLKGEAGSTIVSMEKTGHVGTADIYTITFNDGSTTEISLENMSAITSVEMTSSTDTEDIYTITCADGSTQTFSVLNHNADIAAMSDDIDTIDARVDNFINSVVPNTVETLWTGSIKDVGDSATLSKAVSNFDYIDLYLLGSADSKYIRVPATQAAVEIQQQNLSDDASSNFLRLWEMGVSISGTTVSITKSIAWAWDDPDNSNPTVTANAQNGVPITRIDGVKVASDTPAEVTDIRVGADGTTYNSAGAAVRGQISDLNEHLTKVSDAVITPSDNLFNKEKANLGYVLNSSGNGMSASTGQFVSDYIDVSDISALSVYRYNNSTISLSNVYYVLYDASKGYLGARAAGSSIDTSGSSVKFVRISTNEEVINQLMVCKSTFVPTSYVPYALEFKYLDQINQNTEDIAQNTADIASMKSFTHDVYGANKIDPDTSVIGYLDTDGTVNSENTSYKTSDFIPVEANTTYTLYFANTTGQSVAISRLTYCLYNTSKAKVSYATETGVGYLTITASADGYIRVCSIDDSSHPYYTELLMFIDGTTKIPYEQYSKETFLSDSINPNNDKSGNILFGKKWVHCGDSFSFSTNAQFASGKYINQDKSFPRLIALRNGMELEQQFMRSGRTMAYPSDGTFTNSLTCPTNAGYYQNIPTDADYVTIMLGINDINHASGSGTTPDGEDATGVITLGTIDDDGTDTYYGAYNNVLEWLRTYLPFAHIGIVVTNGTENQGYTEAQIALAEKWGYPYINLNGDERTPAMIRSYNPHLSASLKQLIKQKQAIDPDGTITGSINLHPNYQTHELESGYIEGWLRSL